MRLCLAVLLAFAVFSAGANDTGERVSAVKAAFVFNILKFTQWPDRAQRDEPENLSLCVLRDRQMLSALRQLSGRALRGYRLDIRALEDAGAVAACDAVFVGGTENGYGDVFDKARSGGVLSIADAPQAIEAGAMVTLVPQGTRIGIAVNVEAARTADIRFSAELLKLAQIVETPAGVVQ